MYKDKSKNELGYKVFSPKMNKIIELYSEVEYIHWLQIECNPYVKYFIPHPVRYENIERKRLVQTVFSMWIQYTDNIEEFIEIRYEEELNKECNQSKENMRQIETHREWCLENGYKYTLKTEKDIYLDDIYRWNLEEILRAVKEIQPKVQQELVIKIVDLIRRGKRNIKELTAYLDGNEEEIRGIVAWLMYTGIVSGNLIEVPFSEELRLEA